MDRLLAHPTGLEFTVLVARRHASDDLVDPLDRGQHRGNGGLDPPAEVLRLGIAYVDGRKASSLARPPHWEEENPKDPVLVMRSGHGSRGRWEKQYWLWPLPPEGPTGFVVHWPAEGVDEWRVDVDGAAIHAAADQALALGDG